MTWGSYKARGEWVELQFMARGASENLQVLKPWGESGRYDVAVEHRARFSRVQVKSCLRPARGRNSFQVKVSGCRNGPYTANQIDFIAAYLISLDLWYIIPIQLLRSRNGRTPFVMINPEDVHGKWRDCEETWDRLRGEEAASCRQRKNMR